MSDDELFQRIRDLERDNARLRRLLDETGSPAGLRHQTRNTLAMVRDVIRRSAETSDNVEDYAAHLEGRLDAVFRIQTTIANRLLDGVSLHTLLADELMVHAISRRDELSIDGPDILLTPAAASALALAFHELSTNAVKFGPLGLSGGRLSVTWSVATGDHGQPWLSFHWVESGGMRPATPVRRGFGSEVIEHAVPYQLDGIGSLAFTPSGVRCTLRLPLKGTLGRLQPPTDIGSANDEPEPSSR
jgi:two-component sensor histidine kinase